MSTNLTPGAVVVGVDGSAPGDAAVEWAAAHALSVHRPLVLVHGAGAVGHLHTVDERREHRMTGRRVTDRALAAVRRTAPTLRVEAVTRDERPVDLLLGLSQQASTVVVGTRGLGAVRSRLLGSVSTAVAERAACPVAVVRPAEPGLQTTGPVVVGVDVLGTSRAALELAFELASAEGRRVHAVHAWQAHDTFVDEASWELRRQVARQEEELFRDTLHQVAAKYPDVPIERSMPEDVPGRLLVDLSQTAAAVVLGSRGRTGVTALLGSVSRHVLEHARCTVVVVRNQTSAPARAATIQGDEARRLT